MLKRYPILVFFMVIVVVSGSNAQWKRVASNIFGAQTQYGKMHFSSGGLWVGGTSLWMSPDTGKSWTKRGDFASDQIWDIRFFDSNNGVVGTVGGSVFKTSNRGLTWNVIKQNPSSGYIYSLCYANTKNDIIVANGNLGTLSYTHDGGLTWQDVSLRTFTLYLESLPSGTIYALSGDLAPNSYHLNISTDQGETWQEMPGAFDPDCFSFAVSCDENIIVAPNEAAAFAFDIESEPYVTTDKGVTWNSHVKYPQRFLAGSISHAENIFYIQSADEVMRSTDNGITWKNIGGPGNTLDTRFLSALDRNLVFALDKQGNVWCTTNSGGDSLNQSVSKGSISFSPRTLFQGDTLVCIDSVIRPLLVKRTGCNPPSVKSAILSGANSSNYSILSIRSDSIQLSFSTKVSGGSSALLLLELTDGIVDTVFLAGYYEDSTAKVSLSPKTLFQNDTIVCIDSVVRSLSVAITGCNPPSVKSVMFSGIDSSNYSILSIGSDSIQLSFGTNISGASTASLLVELTNGMIDTIFLAGYKKDSAFKVSYYPPSLFFSDTLYSCDRPIRAACILNVTGCPSRIVDQRITGSNASAYTIHDSLTTSNFTQDSVVIDFSPSSFGPQSGNYEVLFDNNYKIIIPLGGFLEKTKNMSISTEDVSTDTLGGTVQIPFSILGSISNKAVDLVLHYDISGSMIYVNSYSSNGTLLDIPGQRWQGRSKLRLPNVIASQVYGYSHFTVFADSTKKPQVWFDSLVVLNSASPCEYDADTAVSTITPPQGCGINILSEFLLSGKMPHFFISPNPSENSLNVRSSESIDNVHFLLFDQLGKTIVDIYHSMDTTQGVSIDVSSIPSGMYYLRINSGQFTTTRLVVIDH